MFNFAMFTGSTQDQTSRGPKPGLDLMADYVRRKRLKARLPSVQDVAKAIKSFVNAAKKAETSDRILDTQAALLTQSLLYTAEHSADGATAVEATGGEEEEIVMTELLEGIASLLFPPTGPFTTAHLELARLLQQLSPTSMPHLRFVTTCTLVQVLCELDLPAEAQLVFTAEQYTTEPSFHSTSKESSGAITDPVGSDSLKAQDRGLWRSTLTALMSSTARQDSEADTLAMLEIMQKYGEGHTTRTLGPVMDFYMKRNDRAKLETYLDTWLEATRPKWRNNHTGQLRKLAPALRTLRQVLTYAIQSNQVDLGHRIIADIMRTSPAQPVWIEVIAFGFAIEKSVDEVNRMLDVMIKSNESLPDGARPRMPDIRAINRLVEVAIAADDPYLAERLIALGRSRGIEPDATTLVHQMQYRLSVKDIDGALLAYKNLQSKDLSSEHDVPAVNDLIIALCSSGRHDFDTIMNVAADLSDRRATFTAGAVQALAIVHLKRDEVRDVEDLIKTHAYRFSSVERAAIRTAIKDFAIQPNTAVATMWDSYQILRNELDEMPREERTQIMQACFEKGRTDMAVHVFRHMRMHSRNDTYPNAATYVAAFMGAAKTADEASLDALHNQLRLDTLIDVTTSMRNALMIALLAVDRSMEALHTWNDIVDSQEGPSYNSILIALRACEMTPRGHGKADEIWSRLRRNSIELDQRLWAAYVAALARNGQVAQAVKAVNAAFASNELEVDTLVLGRLCNAAAMVRGADDVKQWAMAEHAEAWKELQRLRVEARDRLYQIDDVLEP